MTNTIRNSVRVLVGVIAVATPVLSSPQAVDRVVVFADRAEVTRAAPATCRGGTASVVFEALPEAIDPRTLRGEADGDAVVVGVSMSTTALVERIDAEVKKLQDEVQALDDQIAVIERAQIDDDERLLSMNSYGAWFRTLIKEDLRQPKPDVGRWEQLLTTMRSEQVSSSTTRVARSAELRTIGRRRERLANRLARLNPSTAPSNVVATVAVQCKTATSSVVRLSYVVPGARWNPEYDLRFTGPARARVGDGKAVLTVAGVVTQSSGEDWVDAEIWLSTAKPRLGGEAPLPNAIYVNGRPEDAQKTLVQAQEHRADALKAGNGGGGGATGAALEDGGKAFVLKLKKRVTVRADGRPYWFPIDDVSTSARSSLVAVPSLSPWVFQAVALNNPAAYPLMAGTIHVFRAGTYIGDESLPYRAPGEPIEMSLGIDEQIALERVDLVAQNREAGFFSGSQSIVQSWRTILRNRSGEDVSVEIREQVPVTKTADIVVTLDPDKTTAGYAMDALRGHLRWQVAIKKGASAQRDVNFTIALPKEWAVQ